MLRGQEAQRQNNEEKKNKKKKKMQKKKKKRNTRKLSYRRKVGLGATISGNVQIMIGKRP